MVIKHATKRVWYECTDGNMGNSFNTEIEALEELASMQAGYPENNYLSEENRAYWIKHSEVMYITRVTKITKIITS